MIKIRIRNADHEIDIRFPISESELFAKLGEIHAVEGRDAAQSALVTAGGVLHAERPLCQSGRTQLIYFNCVFAQLCVADLHVSMYNEFDRVC